jgi:hypothetical protein
MARRGKDGDQQVQPLQTFAPRDLPPVRTGPQGSADNDLLKDVNKDQARATAFGTDPEGFQRSLSRTATKPVYSGRGKDKTQIGTRQVTFLSTSNRKKFEKAQADFESRGGSNATAEATSRGSGGGTFQTSGDFGPGSIQIGGVKPLGG